MQKRMKISLFAIFAAVLIFGIVTWIWTPTFEETLRLAVGSDRVLLAQNGEPLQTLRTDFKKRRLSWTPLAGFPKSLQEAIVLSEDHRFFYHPGIDPVGFSRALMANLRGQRIQGASTLTMQLTDLIQPDVLLHNRGIQKGSIAHKLLQMSRALGLELRWSKNEILEAYLNLIHLKGEFQGVPAVTYAYLNKDPLALDGMESLTIAAMISSPNQKAPALKLKTCALHKRQMKDQQTSCQASDAAVEKFFEKTPSMPASPGYAPHIARRLFKEFGNESILTSTLQKNLQQKIISILEKNTSRLKNSNVHDSAAIVIDNQTGEVLAYVGTVSSSKSPHVDGVASYRQAGSSLKPFLYGKAIDTKTLTAASILLDEPTAISWGGDVYRPSNYDKHFYGPVSVREALGSSLNVPAVKTVTIIGLHETYKVLQSLRLSNLKEPDFYGVSMALGAVEVRLDELANAYRMLANGGLWSPLRFVKEETKAPSQKVFSAEASYIIGSMLSDSNARAIGFGWASPLETSFWSAVKTGTSKDYRDNWCVGYSERYTVAVWTGNFDAEAMNKVSGVSGAGPSWHEIMTYLHTNEKSSAPPMPANVVAKKIRHQWNSHLYPEYFIKGTEPLQEVIEPAPEKRVQFVFPAEGSILVKDPHMDQEHVALFIRFKGHVPEKSQLLWNGNPLGEALSPFKIPHPAAGQHELSIVNEGKVLARVKFTIRGAE